ncbi:NADPH-dependent assimilatory sulfite reductase hemoprotein subunit [Synechococcus sp. UW140]|uniref:NADPH-dependent assimilatory sulfite reductase hemoprotein subunit n=1 Tax=Synechococcus sp. UW140 TaxID=368503 RepID=UPI0025F6252A|nr:NADPH-dependent assimilatory sulfite reductase hemoprotein subunit [Synechococcus sp. UW140]
MVVAKTLIRSLSQPVTIAPTPLASKEPSKFEQLKANSQHLREPLASELENDLPFFTDGAVQILKFHGSYQQDNRDNRLKGQAKDWGMMLRLRSPGGKVPAQLFLALDQLANQYGNGSMRVTTRQAFQLHGIAKQDLRTVLASIVRNLGSTLAACGDINRNVMAPAAPYEGLGYPVARRLADDIADLLAPKAAAGAYLELWVDGEKRYKIRPSIACSKVRKRQLEGKLNSGDPEEPLYGSTYMPRKFKVGVTVPGDNSIDLLTQDLGLVAFTDLAGKLRGCNVYVGGGMGRTHNKEETFARSADCLGYVKGTDVLDLVQAVVALQRDNGDREQRRHGRMKYLIHDRGIAWFRSELERYFPGGITAALIEPKPVLEDYLGWHQQGDGRWFVGLPLLCGRLDGERKVGLRKLVERYLPEIRLTANQDILLCNIARNQRQEVAEALAEIGWTNPAETSLLSRHAIACPALPTCGLAITESERILPSVIERLEKLLEAEEITTPILLRMTGCPNGCARPYMAELALVGSGVDQYQLWLGGNPGLTRLAQPILDKLPLMDLEITIKPLLQHWRDNGKKQSFGDYCNQLEKKQLMDLLQPQGAVP